MSYTVNDRRSSTLFGPDGRKLDDSINHVVNAPSAAYGSFQGAMHTKDRGYVYVPTLDSRQEVDQMSRIEMMRRSRFIYNSGGGLPHRFIHGTARMVVGAGIWPHPMSKDKAWNVRRRELFMERAGNAETFDLSKKYDWAAGLRAIYRGKKKDGDIAVVFALNEDNRLRCRFYESHQIGSTQLNILMPSLATTGGFQDGIQLDRHNAPVAMRIVGRDTLGNETSVDIGMENVRFCLDYERPGQVRGLPMLYPVLNKVLDLGEIRAALTKGIKVSAQVAYAIEQQMPQSGSTTIGANTGYEPPRPTKLVQGQDGKILTLEQFLTGGEALSLQAGQSFKIVQSQNPHANVSDYMKEIERDIVACGDWPYEVVRNIVDLGGANTRFVLADCQSKIEEEQDALLDQFGTAFYHRQTRDLIDAGELWDVADWDRAAWTFPARLTVDFGRDGRLHIERYKRGMVTMKSLYGYTGDEWQPEVDQFLDERQYIVQGVINRKITDHDGTVRAMTMIEAYPEIQPAPAAAAAPEPDTHEEDAPKPEPIKKNQRP